MKTQQIAWGRDIQVVRNAVDTQFDIVLRIGVGGSSSVFAAVRRADGRRVALKVMHATLLSDAQQVARFQREARATAQLTHPNIVPIYSAAQLGGLHCIEMPLFQGSLRDRIHASRYPVPLPVALHWLAHVCSAVDHAHCHGVLHRDLSPSNILIDDDGSAVVSDFGLALEASDVRLTDGGFVAGTASYMSPQRRAGEDATIASDLYSIGMLALELLTGHTVAPLETSEQAGAVLQSAPQPCPPPIRDAILRLLARQAADRFSSASEAAAALHAHPLAAGDPNLRWTRAFRR